MKPRTDAEIIDFLNSKSEFISETGCQIFLGGLNKDGYGQTWYQGKNITTHRLSYKLHKGELKDGLVIMHTCDMPSCINPNHLNQVMQSINNDDKMIKGRHKVASGDDHYMRINRFTRAGEKCPTVKLKEQQVLEIRKLFADGLNQSLISSIFSISRTCVSAIVTRRNWKHI
jgi:hypothetical protein